MRVETTAAYKGNWKKYWKLKKPVDYHYQHPSAAYCGGNIKGVKFCWVFVLSPMLSLSIFYQELSEGSKQEGQRL